MSYEAKTSFKIIVGIWLLCMVVLVNAYAGVLTSLLTVPKLEPIVNTLQELVENQYLGLGGVTVERASSIVKDLMVNKNYYYYFNVKNSNWY